MENRKKVIYVGVTNDFFTHLKDYVVLSEYSNGSVLVLDDRRCKWIMYQGTFIVKN